MRPPIKTTEWTQKWHIAVLITLSKTMEVQHNEKEKTPIQHNCAQLSDNNKWTCISSLMIACNQNNIIWEINTLIARTIAPTSFLYTIKASTHRESDKRCVFTLKTNRIQVNLDTWKLFFFLKCLARNFMGDFSFPNLKILIKVWSLMSQNSTAGYEGCRTL